MKRRYWFDVEAFVVPAQFVFGNAGRGILVAPGNYNVDLGVHRNFRFTEKWRMSLCWEMFNAFNRANFGSPNAAIGNAGRSDFDYSSGACDAVGAEAQLLNHDEKSYPRLLCHVAGVDGFCACANRTFASEYGHHAGGRPGLG